MTNENHDDDDDYEVGYRKPPRHTRFEKGCSGNPKGRRKKARRDDETLGEMLTRVTRGTVRLTMQGKSVEVTKLEAVLEQVTNQAARGNVPAVRVLVMLMERFVSQTAGSRDTAIDDGSGTDDEIIERFLRRRRAAGDPTDDGEAA